MALIKGSKVNQAGSVVVQGGQITAEEAKPARGGRSRPGREPETIIIGGSGIVQADPDEPDLAVRRSPARTPLPETELDFEATPDFEAEEQTAAEFHDREDPLGSWDVARSEMLEASIERAEIAAQEATQEAISPSDAYEELVGEATERFDEAFGEGTEERNAALESVIPSLEQQAAARAEFEAVAAAARARWRELADAEEQIAALLANFDLPEGASARLLAEREQILSEARLNAASMMGMAQEEAARLRADAETQIALSMQDFETTKQQRFEQLREEARAAGYTEGRSQADEEGAKIIEEAIETLNRARLAYPRAVRENQDKLMQLAMEVAEKIVQGEIATKPEIVMRTLDEALNRVTDMESVIIRVNPEDLAQVEAEEDRLRDILAQVKKLEFASSVKIARGGVYIETGSGLVDATIKTQFSVLQEVFRGVQKELEQIQDTDAEAFEELDR